MYSTLTSAPIRPNSRGIKKSHTTDMASPMAFYMGNKWSLSEIWGVGGTVVSTPWLYVRRVFPVSLYLYQTPQVFSEYSGFLLHKHWTSRENSLVMTDRVSLYIVYLSLWAGG